MALDLRVARLGVLLLMVSVPPATDAHAAVRPIRDKTLVAWVAPTNLTQGGGAVIGIGGTAQSFDAIVFGEIAPARWMAGSNYYERTDRQQDAYPIETAGPDELVMIAISYEGRQVRIFRNGERYAEYTMATEPREFTTGDIVTLGLRHKGASRGYLAGTIEDARIYDVALDGSALAELEPNRLTGPRPIGWWTFEDGSTQDGMGSFPEGDLFGGARIEEGRLVLDGQAACMIVRRSPTVARTEEGWPWYHVTALPDEGIALPYDANGCIYWKGKYHLMYIFQSDDGRHCWGHLASPDLVHWTYLPTALEPRPGDADTGTFSGNAFINKDGVPMLCWFGIDAGVCVATALDDDLVRWEKHPGNPIIPMPKEGEPGYGVYTVWDPYLWLEGDTYYCLLGGNRLPIDRDTLYLCTSPDLVNWTPKGPFYTGDPEWRRPDEDCSCPDFFRLQGKRVLMCISHAIGARAYIGRMEGEEFIPEQHVRMNWPGGMFFAPESLEDAKGRRVFWAWVTDPRVRPAQEPTGSGFQSLPRVLGLDEAGEVRITPAQELTALRGAHRRVEGIRLAPGEGKTLEAIRGAHIELSADIGVERARQVVLSVLCSEDGREKTSIIYDADAGALRLDMSRSTLRDDVTYGSPPFTSYGLQRARDNANPIGSFDAPLALRPGERLRLRVFIDGPMVEAFANDRQCLTQVVFPKGHDSDRVRLSAVGGEALVRSIDAWEMGPLEFTDQRWAEAGPEM